MVEMLLSLYQTHNQIQTYWEVLENETEIGLETKFLNNRIGLDLTFFNREDSQLPVAIPVPGSTGYSGLSINSGVTSSKGWELAISGTPIQTDNITWDVAVNFATLEKRTDFYL